MSMHFIQSGILASFFFASLVALLSIPCYQIVRHKLTLLPCQIRSKILTLWLLSPVLIGGILTLSGLLPSWMDSHEIATQHCTSHNNGIAHLCWFDPIVHISDVIWIIGASIMALVMLFNARKVVNLMIKYWRFQSTLQIISEKQTQANVFRIASERFFVFSSGLFAPHAFISSQLLHQLSAKQLEVVLAHEQEHCLRRDVLRRLILSFTGLFHFPGTRQHLLSDLELTHEQICDIAAVQKVGDRFLVAETIIKIARQLNTLVPEQEVGVIAFNGSHIDIRIQQLLNQPKPVNRDTLLFSTLLFSLILYGILSLTMPLHHFL